MEAQPLVKLECCISFGNCNLIGNIKGAFLEWGNSCSMFQSGIFIHISVLASNTSGGTSVAFYYWTTFILKRYLLAQAAEIQRFLLSAYLVCTVNWP